MNTPLIADPMAFFREALGQWEKLANEFGTKLTGSEPFAQTMHGATALGVNAQSAMHEAMAKVLAASNMPSRADIEGLGTRLAQIETTLARIDVALSSRSDPAASMAPKPRRTKTPPTGA